jgi:competence protein ComEC
VSERLIEKENSYKTVLEVEKVFLDEKQIKTSGKLLAYFKKSKKILELKYGDILFIKSRVNEVNEAQNPYQFNYKSYLELHQINYQVFLDTNSWDKTSKNTANPLIEFSQNMRDKLFTILKNNNVEGNQLKVGSALLLGYREQLNKDIIRSYSGAGAMHVLAVSGLHVGILFLILQHLFQFLNRIKYGNIYFTLIIISALWFYALMTGLSASVMRASTMFSFILIGN